MERYTKDFLVREIAARASFTVGDVKIIFNTFEEIVKEVVSEKDSLMIGGLFHLYCHEIPPHIGFDALTQKEKRRGTTYRLTISPSTTLKKILKNSKINPPEEEGSTK